MSTPYALPMRARFRGLTTREGVLIHGSAGWGEFCPFDDYDDVAAIPWLRSAMEAAETGWPTPLRWQIPVNCTVPVVTPDQAYEITANSRCGTAKVKVADQPAPGRGHGVGADEERLRAVRAALGPDGKIRIDANAAWDVDSAVRTIRRLDRAAGGLEYVEQPCRTLDELAAVRRKVDVRIAADESIRRAEDPLRVAVAEAADIAVLKCAPLGGVRRALEVAEACGLPCVVSSALETSVGLAAEIALAAALPSLDFACGLATRALLAADVVPPERELWPVDGMLTVVRTAPEPDLALLRSYGPTEERRAWWEERLARVRRLHSTGMR